MSLFVKYQPLGLSGGGGGVTTGDLTDVGTDGIVITGGTGAVVGTGTSIAQHVADASHNGYLSSTDWSTFNNKQPALALTNLTDAGTDGITITNGTGAVIGASPVTIAQHVADTTHNGYLSSADWNTFNGKGSGSVTSVAMTVPTFLSVSGSPITTSGTLGVTLSGTALPVANGGTGVTSVTIAPSATAFAGWDANSNFSANAFIPGFATTATAGSTTTLTIASAETQAFTGSTTQTVKLPTTSVAQGAQYTIINQSTGNVTVQSSGANSIVVLSQNQTAVLTAAVATPTTAGNWYYSVTAISGGVTTVGSFSSSSTANGLDISGTTITLHAGDATNPGAVTTTTQTFAGAKTFTSDTTHTTAAVGGTSIHAINTDTGGKDWRIISTGSANTGGAGAFGLINVTDDAANYKFKITAAGVVSINNLTASQAIVTDASKNLISLAYNTAATASNLAEWDTHANLGANNLLPGYTSIATAAGTTTFAVQTAALVYFTGSTTQTATLPVTSTLVLGQNWTIVNLSTGVVTVQSSGANTIQAMAANTILSVTCILTSGTGTASWSASYKSLSGSALTVTTTAGSGVNYIVGGPSASGSQALVSMSGSQPLLFNSTTGELSVGGRVSQNQQTTATAAGTTTLTIGSAVQQTFTGSTTQILVLPDATTLGNWDIWVHNNSSGVVTVKKNDTTTVVTTIVGGNSVHIILTDNSTTNGTWQTATLYSVFSSNNQTASYSLVGTDYFVKFSGLSGDVTATLPDATTISGKYFSIKNADASHKVTINTTSSQTLDGRGSGVIILAAGYNDFIEVISDGSNWQIKDKKETQVLTATGSHTTGSAPSSIYVSGSATVTLTYGTWRVWGTAQASMNSAGATAFGSCTGAFYSADGANNGTPPTALSGTPLGQTSGGNLTVPVNATAAAVMLVLAGPMIYTVTSNTAIFCVPQVSASTGTVSVSSNITAERIW